MQLFFTKDNMIRKVELKDADEITSIYNYYIENTVITFEEKKLSSDDIKKRINIIIKNYPWIVFEENDQVLGYAYASKFRERSAYRYSTETTVYLNNKSIGKGIGSLLYIELLKQIRMMNFKVAYGVISLPNTGSVKLHEKFGFIKVAHLSNVGYKFNKWIDVGYWELLLK